MRDDVTEPSPGTPCAACGRPIQGAYLRDPRGQFFCGSHALTVCRFCNKGFEPAKGAAPDRCPACANVAVVSAHDAKARYDFVADWFGSEGLTFAGGAPPFRLADKMPVAPNGRPMLGFADKLLAPFPGKPGKVRAICVQSGLPRFLFGVVTAHELGHAYLCQRGDTLSEPIEEGVCDWLAHAFALRIGTEEIKLTAHRLEINPDPVNGIGFRRVRAIAGNAKPRDLPKLLPALARA
jgi:hypothetical protein